MTTSGVLIVGAHEIAGVYHERAGATCDGRAYGRVLQLHFRVFDSGGVGADTGFERCSRRACRVTLLARADAALDEVVHALRNDLCVVQLRGIARQIRFRLMQRGFERPMIEPEQHLLRLNIVALVEVDLSQLAGHLRSYGDGRERLGGADDVRVERHDFLDHSIDGDGHRGLRRARFWTLRVACRTCRKHGTDPE